MSPKLSCGRIISAPRPPPPSPSPVPDSELATNKNMEKEGRFAAGRGGGGGRGVDSYDRKKDWSSINLSILSDVGRGFTNGFPEALQYY